jgi:predicted DsbA family dithiol-disulfide isomerase
MRVEIYSDVVCPWCYIGARRLTKALAAFPADAAIEVVYRPFQLDPTASEEPVPLPQHLERRFGKRVDEILERVTTTAKGEDIGIEWDKALAVNTRTAHRLLTWAEQQYGAATQRALAEALFRLYFTEGGNIADVEPLATAAAAAGIDPDAARAYLQSENGVEELEAEFEQARRLGVRAVPTFVIDGRYALQGAQSVATFVTALEQAGQTPSTGR